MKKLIPVFALALVAFVCVAGQNIVKADSEDVVRIVDGVFIDHVDVSGMTADEAKAEVNAFVAKLQGETFTLKSENGSIEANVEDMGLTCDVDTAVEEAVAVGHSGSLIRRYKETVDLQKSPQVVSLRMKVDNQTTAQLLYNNGDELNLEAVNMGLIRENGVFKTTEGKDGNTVKYVESVGVINEFVNAWTPGSASEIALVCEDVKYLGTAEQLAEVKDVLGSFSTSFGTGSGGRETNVKNGCRCINGAVLYPGEEFSANAAMEPYTYENGYADGGSYENGRVVSSIGGGICQVSSTLYNAVIRAELEITKRAAHSMVVGYVDISDDAAIAGDYKDLRFKNNTDTPIYIEGYCSGGNIYFNIYGKETREKGRVVSFETEVLETDVPDTNFVLNADLDLGYYNKDVNPHIGYKARLWKIVTVNGVEESRKIFNNSRYSSAAGTTTIGTKGASAEQLAAINNAIAQAKEAKDDAIVESTVAGLSAPAATTPTEPTKPTNPSTDNAGAGSGNGTGSSTGTGAGNGTTLTPGAGTGAPGDPVPKPTDPTVTTN